MDAYDVSNGTLVELLLPYSMKANECLTDLIDISYIECRCDLSKYHFFCYHRQFKSGHSY